MTYSSAVILFEAMRRYSPDNCEHVIRCFTDLIRNKTGLRDAFIQAVEAECEEIEVDMLLARDPEGTA